MKSNLIQLRTIALRIAWLKRIGAPSGFLGHSLGQGATEVKSIVERACEELKLSPEQREMFFYGSVSPILTQQETVILIRLFELLRRWEREEEEKLFTHTTTIPELVLR